MTNEQILNLLYSQRRIEDNGCWRYTGAITPNGYGRISIDGKHWGVHRLIAIILLGLSKDKYALHKQTCPNKDCFNPDHLYIGTQSQNVRDALDLKPRPTNTHCPRCGNEYSIRKGGRDKGQHYCKICSNEATRRYRARLCH